MESVYFTLDSTDQGDYGMNTAAYFCMDKFQVEEIIPTAVNDQLAQKTVASVEYVNMAGQKSDTAFDGINVKVTRYTDGTSSTAKVVK